MQTETSKGKLAAACYFLIVSSIFIASLVLFDTTKFNSTMEANTASCFSNQEMNLPDSADVLFFGSSRTLLGIWPDVFEKQFGEHIENAYNMGRPLQNGGRNYHILEGLLEKGVRPKIVFVELNHRHFSDPGKTRDRFGHIFKTKHLSYKDLYHRAKIFEDENFLSQYKLVTHQWYDKTSQALSNLLSGRFITIALEEERPADKICWRESFDKPVGKRGKQALEKRRIRVETRARKMPKIFDAEKYLLKHDIYYANKFRGLADEYGFDIYFSVVMASYLPAYEQDYLDQIRQHIPEFIYPSPTFIKKNSARYKDAVHMNLEGREAYTKWLATEIKKESSKSKGSSK